MLNKSYYFQHDYNAANDEKILYLRSIYGMEGYGLYWYFIELMHQSPDSKLKCKLINGIAYQLNIDIDLLLSFYNNCIEIELFVTDGILYWSDRVLSNKELQDEKRKLKSFAGKKGMEKRWGITDNNTVIIENNKIKESKVKENKLKETKVKENIDVVYPFDSDEFKNYWFMWKEYKKKQFKFTFATSQSEQAALKDLVNLSNGQEDIALKIIEQSMAKGWKGFFTLKNETNAAGISYNRKPTYAEQQAEALRNL